MQFRFSVIALLPLTFTVLLWSEEPVAKIEDQKKAAKPARQWFVSGDYYRDSQTGALTLRSADLAMPGALTGQDVSGRNTEATTHDVPQWLPPSQSAWKLEKPVPRPGPTQGFFRVKSQPDGADVFVDGTFVGTTPTVEVRLNAGQHVITVRKLGYAEWHQNAMLVAGDKMELSAEMGGKSDAGGKPRFFGLE